MNRLILGMTCALCASLVGSACATKSADRAPVGQELAAYDKVSWVPTSWQKRIGDGGAKLTDYQVDAGRPFTPEQIRASNPDGMTLHAMISEFNFETSEMQSIDWTMSFQGGDETTVGIEQGPAGGPQGGARQTWEELAAHADFGAGTLRWSARVQVSEGGPSIDAWVYARPNFLNMTWIYVFNKAHPGAPYLLESWSEGRVVGSWRINSTEVVPPATQVVEESTETEESTEPSEGEMK
ncbi:MAG: hypothetical protein KDB07_00685 [Planctomycetes bacterium]|nr:hypothetical protein [Planctomycetota bacterium]